MNNIDYDKKAKELRRKIVTTLHHANGSFAGGALSCIDILTVLYHGFLRIDCENPFNPDRDMFLLSKGHCSSAMYASLVSVGLMTEERLKDYGVNGTTLGVHPKKDPVHGIEISSGSLGHGLPIGIGSALAAKIRGSDARVYVLMGDGECNEGSIWESAAFASRQKLDNLIVLVDRNHLQGCGRDEEVLNYGDIGEKFRAFGFHVCDTDGHNYNQIAVALQEAIDNDDKPTAIIANTVKGKGVSFMEDRLEWHYKSTTAEQYAQAMEELQ